MLWNIILPLAPLSNSTFNLLVLFLPKLFFCEAKRIGANGASVRAFFFLWPKSTLLSVFISCSKHIFNPSSRELTTVVLRTRSKLSESLPLLLLMLPLLEERDDLSESLLVEFLRSK